MNIIASISKAICVVGSIVLLFSVFFHFEKDIEDWDFYKRIIMAIVAIAFASFLIVAFKKGNFKKLREILVVGIILLIVVVLAWLLA